MIYDRPINIMLVDDHPMMRDALRGRLETRPTFRVVAEAADAEEALRHANDMAIDLVVTDIEMPGTDGIALTTKFRTKFPAIAVLVFTLHHEEEFILRAIEAGARGYVNKKEPGSIIINAINKIIKGQTVFPQVAKPESLLTLREKQVFWLLGDVKTNEDIAIKFDIVEHTVADCRSRILQKLRTVVPVEMADNPALLIIYAVKYRMRCHYPDS